MSNEIKAGDKVTQPGDDTPWTVEHVRGEWAWCFGSNSHSGDLLFLETLTKYEEPKVPQTWEVGKVYRRRDYFFRPLHVEKGYAYGLEWDAGRSPNPGSNLWANYYSPEILRGWTETNEEEGF